MTALGETGRGRLVGLVVAVLVVWTATALAYEVVRARRICAFAAAPATFGEQWRVGSDDWRALDDFLSWVARVAPSGSAIAFRSKSRNAAVAWSAAYLLPDREVIPILRTEDLDQADFVAIYHDRFDQPNLELVLEHPHGHLYRVPP